MPRSYRILSPLTSHLIINREYDPYLVYIVHNTLRCSSQFGIFLIFKELHFAQGITFNFNLLSSNIHVADLLDSFHH